MPSRPAGRWVWIVLVILLVLLALVVGCCVASHHAGGGRYAGGAEDDFPFLHRDLPTAAAMFATLKRSQPREVAIGQGRQRGISRRWPKDLYASDGLSSHFTEGVRARCRFTNVKGPPRSPREAWDDPDTRAIIEREAKKLLTTPSGKPSGLTRTEALREGMYSQARWCNFYNPAFCLWIYRKLAATINSGASKIRILDPSAGWGDRLLAACAFGAAQYHGYDPNTELRDGYDRILDEFAPSRASKRFTVTTGRFEAAAVPDSSYDIVHTSPPFFDLEDYPAEGGKVAKLHPKYEDWVAAFYQPYLAKAWAALRPGGCFCLYIDDVRGAPLAADSKRILGELGATYLTQYGFSQELDWPELEAAAPASGQRRGGKKKKKVAWRPAFVWRKPEQPSSRPHAGASPATVTAKRAQAARQAGDLVIDTLNLTHYLTKGADPIAGRKVASLPLGAQTLEAIEFATPLLRAHHDGRLYFVLKDPDGGRARGRTDPGKYAELAKRLNVYIHIAERDADNAAADWQKLGETDPTHQKVGRDDFYMGYLAWKHNCAVLTEDRMRDFEKLKTEVRPFRVRAFDSWRAPQVNRLFPGAQEYKRIRRPATIRFAEYGL